MTKKKNIGLPLKEGQIIRKNGKVYEVAEDVKWLEEFGTWGSVLVIGGLCFYTHKGGIELIIENPLTIKP